MSSITLQLDFEAEYIYLDGRADFFFSSYKFRNTGHLMFL